MSEHITSFTPRTFHPAVLEQCRNLYFRQSMLYDYMTCPYLALFGWIAQEEETQPSMAAVLGTAGHKVVYDMHELRDYNLSYLEIMKRFSNAFDNEISRLTRLPLVSQAYNSLEEERDAKAVTYTELLQNYQAHDVNQQFFSTIHEQSFVLSVSTPTSDQPYLFTGQLDQAGYYSTGAFALRDIKFRDSAFKPTRHELALNMQLTIYALALRDGVPACAACRPAYAPDGTLAYHGPCKECTALIGTPRWPRRLPDSCELVWMRDYEKYEKDQYAKFIPDPNKEKSRNPLTGRYVIKKVINPKYLEGYKKGERRGGGILSTTRTPESVLILMQDVLRICEDIRNGVFYRRPGQHCTMWCHFNESCRGGLELELDELSVAFAREYSVEDPFAP